MIKRSSILFYVVDEFDKKNNRIFLVTLNFSIPEYKKLKYFDKLNGTVVNLLHLINEYGKKHKFINEVILYFDDDQLQMIEKGTCGRYNIYF